jgi:translation elongation factor EF-4
LNKVDLPHAHPEQISTQIEETLAIPRDEHLYISAKSGLGVEGVLEAVVNRLPPPGEWEDRVDRLSAGEGVSQEIRELRRKEDGNALRGLIIDT